MPGVPTATTILALRYRDGVIMAGDRQATEGYQVAHRRIEKIFKSDDSRRSASPARPVPPWRWPACSRPSSSTTRRSRATSLSLEGKANKLGQMIRMNLPMAMQGLVVVPIFAGFDARPEWAGSSSTTSPAGATRRADYVAQGSGGKDARDSLKKLFRRDMGRDEALAGRARGPDRRGGRGRRHRRPRLHARDLPDREDDHRDRVRGRRRRTRSRA